MSLLAAAAVSPAGAAAATAIKLLPAVISLGVTRSASPIAGLQLRGGLAANFPGGIVPLAAPEAPAAHVAPTNGIGARPMSLLGNGFLGNGGFLPSGDLSSLVSTGISLIGALRSNRSTSSSSAVLPGAGLVPTGPSGLPPFPGPMGTIQRGAERVGSAIAGRFRRRRRINPLNVRAARRAIRRIKAVRKITAQIERALPTRRVAARGFASPGVITRREASRALRR